MTRKKADASAAQQDFVNPAFPTYRDALDKIAECDKQIGKLVDQFVDLGSKLKATEDALRRAQEETRKQAVTIARLEGYIARGHEDEFMQRPPLPGPPEYRSMEMPRRYFLNDMRKKAEGRDW